MTKFYLVRHGESVGNKTKRFTGSTDLPLTDDGRRQAERVTDFFKAVPLDTIYASPLSRAYDTAAPTAKLKQLEIRKDPAFCEIDGGRWEKVPFAEIGESDPILYEVFAHDIGRLKCPLGESVKDVSERVLKDIYEKFEMHKGQNVAIFSHAIPIRSVITHLSGIEVENMKDVPWVSNASVTEVLYDESTGKASLGRVSVNDYLKDTITPASDLV